MATRAKLAEQVQEEWEREADAFPFHEYVRLKAIMCDWRRAGRMEKSARRRRDAALDAGDGTEAVKAHVEMRWYASCVDRLTTERREAYTRITETDRLTNSIVMGFVYRRIDAELDDAGEYDWIDPRAGC
jgi:hypothetical protein